MSARKLPTWETLSAAQQSGCLLLSQGSLEADVMGHWRRRPWDRPQLSAATGSAMVRLLVAHVIGGRLHATALGLKLLPAQTRLPF